MPRLRPTRLSFLLLALVTIVIGLAVHFRGYALATPLRDIVGDALWAMMVAWLAGAVRPRASVGGRGLASLATCYLVEFSQMYHAPALDALRQHAAGHLVLGSGFDPRDLVSYAAGMVAAVVLEHRFLRPAR